MSAVLELRNVKTCLRTPRGIARPVDGVSFSVEAGKTKALVGESGSGKSMTALTIMQLLPEPAGYVEGGQVLLEGEDLFERSWSQMREVRGREIGMVFQEPMTSLNPAYTIGNQIREAVLVHGGSRKEAQERCLDMLRRVGMREPERVQHQYPHELSGGMRQRAMIAAALVNRPKVLIADEPTTALDVTVQAQILELIVELQREMGMAVLLITHDLGVVAEVAHSVAVMYAGQIVEDAPVLELFGSPRHPYTQDLIASLPNRRHRGQDLKTIPGTVPEATAWPAACRYANRCAHVMPICNERDPKVAAFGAACAKCHLLSPEVAR